VVPFSFREPLLNQLDLPRGFSDAFRGLLLKHVQNIDGILKTRGINGSPRIPVVRSYNLEHAGAAKPLSGLAAGSIPPCWAMKSACPMSILTSAGKERKSRREVPIHRMGFSLPFICIPIYVYSYKLSSLASLGDV